MALNAMQMLRVQPSPINMLGFENRSDTDLADTASAYASAVINTDKFFVYYFSRNCSGLETYTGGRFLEISDNDLPLCTDPTAANCNKFSISLRDSATRRLCQMNLAIRGIEGHIEYGDSFTNDKHPDLRADYLLANPPFNMEDWGFSQVENDPRWRYGKPPQAGARKQKDGSVVNVDGGNANYAWIQHFIQHLNPLGMAGFVMANGSMSTSTTSELEIRTNIIASDLVDCMIALPGQLFYTTQIPVCLWFLSKSKAVNPDLGFRNRQGETLFIDARKMGVLIDRVHRELTEEDINQITRTYHAWRGEPGDAQRGNHKEYPYQDIPGFCKSACLEEIRTNNYVLTPGRYVGIEDEEDDGIPFEEKMEQLTATLSEQMKASQELDDLIRENLKGLEYDL